jgi:uncharacterized membrane protein
VLAVDTVRGWRPAGLGAVAGLALLALIVLALGLGVLLVLFGMLIVGADGLDTWRCSRLSNA